MSAVGRKAEMMKTLLLSGTAFIVLSYGGPSSLIHIPRGRGVNLNETIKPTEWADAGSTEILVQPDWRIRVRFKRDDQNLYFVFEGVKHGNDRLFPEIFIDPGDRKSAQWQKGQWWFHVSYNLCEGNGEPNVYRKDGVFQCAHEKEGWAGNNPSAKDTPAIEVRVSFSKIGVRPARGARLGLAFAVTNATGNETQKWFFWPANGRVDLPATWGKAILD
jgi:hypothetical protein